MIIATQKSPPLPGTRPQGSNDEREASARVREMFTRVAPRYDFLNRLLSLSIDRVWRRRTAAHFAEILRSPEARVLDVCCGTGDLTFALDGRRPPDARQGPRGPRPIFGTDFVEPMLTRAREKARPTGGTVVFAAADSLHLPFADASFDLVTTAFGFRNLANYADGLREFARVLKRGGEVGILEFTEPEPGAMGSIFRFYFERILPHIGGTISGNSEAYRYLPGSVARFPSPPELGALIERTGFADVRMASWNFGSVVLHSARRV